MPGAGTKPPSNVGCAIAVVALPIVILIGVIIGTVLRSEDDEPEEVHDTLQTGAAFLPMTLLIILVAPIAGRTSDRIGSRGLMTAGMVLVAGQLILFSRLGVDSTFWNLLPAGSEWRSP